MPAVSGHQGDRSRQPRAALRRRLRELRSIEVAEAAEIQRAIERMDDGLYGTCMGCGAQIPDVRLRVRPEATLCVRCRTHSALG